MTRLLPLLLAACTPYVYGTDFHPAPRARLIVWPVPGGHRYALDDGSLRVTDAPPRARVASICLIAPPGASDDVLWELGERHPRASLHLVHPVEPWDDVADAEAFAQRFHRQWLATQARRTPRTFPAGGASARAPQIVPLPDGGFAYFGRRSAIGTAAEIVAEVRRDPPRRVEIAVPRGVPPGPSLDLAERLRREAERDVAVMRSPAPPAADLEDVRANRHAIFAAFWPEDDR